MRKMTMLVAAALLFSAGAMAQQAVVGKIEVNVVNVDVTVSSHGQPVHGLTRDDFEIFEDGIAQPLSNFYPVGRTPATIAAKTDSVSATPAVQTVSSGDERFRRKVLVVIDNVHTSVINRNRALEKLERFINDHFTGGEYDWSIAVAGQRLRVVLPLTSDKQAIHDALAMVRGSGTWTNFDSATIVKENAARAFAHSPTLQPEAGLSPAGGRNLALATTFTTAVDALENSLMTANSFVAVRDATRAFANSSGKKVVLLFSDSFGSTNSRVEQVTARFQPEASQRIREASILRDALIREANASNVNVYVINPEGLQGDGEATDNNGLYWLASETGGRFMPGNRPELSLQQFDDASSNYYSLGYRPPHGEDGRYHRIRVALKNRRDYRLQYRGGYTSLPMDVQVVRLLLTPFSTNLQQMNAMELSVSAGEPRRSGGTTTIPLTAHIPVKNLQFIPAASGFDAQVDVYVSIFDSNGKNVSLQRFTTKAHAADAAGQQVGDLIHNATVSVKSGKPYTVVVAVRDGLTDAFGMRSQTLQF